MNIIRKLILKYKLKHLDINVGRHEIYLKGYDGLIEGNILRYNDVNKDFPKLQSYGDIGLFNIINPKHNISFIHYPLDTIDKSLNELLDLKGYC